MDKRENVWDKDKKIYITGACRCNHICTVIYNYMYSYVYVCILIIIYCAHKGHVSTLCVHPLFTKDTYQKSKMVYHNESQIRNRANKERWTNAYIE